MLPESFGALVSEKAKRLDRIQRNEYEKNLINKSMGYGDKVNPDKLRMPKAAFAEEALLGIAQINPD